MRNLLLFGAIDQGVLQHMKGESQFKEILYLNFANWDFFF